MQVRLLGPVDVIVGGAARQVNGVRRKAVLALLGLNAGQIVSTDRLIDLVWGNAPPVTAANTLQSHVSHLRRVLGSRDAILARPPGYLLALGDQATDVSVAEHLIAESPRLTDPAARADQLRTALALWRGRPLVDVAGIAELDERAEQLERLRLTAQRALVDARMALGEHQQLVTGLERLAALHPLDEDLHAQLMLAQYRCGRQADALATYRLLRTALADSLGIDPGPALRDLEGALLRQDPVLRQWDLSGPATPEGSEGPADPPVPAGATAPPDAAPAPRGRAAEPVPAQLPPVVSRFAGRSAELARTAHRPPWSSRRSPAPLGSARRRSR
jgi:DNA-binding SARP family transcriptional activator